MDAFDRFRQWANKPVDSRETIPAELHHAVTSLPMEDWHDREKVNAAARRAASPLALRGLRGGRLRQHQVACTVGHASCCGLRTGELGRRFSAA